MARNAFFSFHYIPDSWRASQVRNMGVLEGNKPATDNDWESITSGGDSKIQKWIDDQMSGKSVVVVLIGADTAGRKWINYEIKKGWSDGKGVLGVHIHGLKNSKEEQSTKGSNPFYGINVDGKSLYSLCPIFDTPYTSSTYVYDHIKENLSDWIEKAIKIRKEN